MPVSSRRWRRADIFAHQHDGGEHDTQDRTEDIKTAEEVDWPRTRERERDYIIFHRARMSGRRNHNSKTPMQ